MKRDDVRSRIVGPGCLTGGLGEELEAVDREEEREGGREGGREGKRWVPNRERLCESYVHCLLCLAWIDR